MLRAARHFTASLFALGLATSSAMADNDDLFPEGLEEAYKAATSIDYASRRGSLVITLNHQEPDLPNRIEIDCRSPDIRTMEGRHIHYALIAAIDDRRSALQALAPAQDAFEYCQN